MSSLSTLGVALLSQISACLAGSPSPVDTTPLLRIFHPSSRSLNISPRQADDGAEGDANTNLDEDHVADVDEQPGDEALLLLLLEFIASGKDRVPDGYITDANGSLRIDTAADMFEEVVVAGEPEVFGRGKRRRLANKQYNAYEQH
ncbi:uncharacterized protein F5891DRAFT_1177759 [Suillus fuscotomentosus]|uniref:Uncharacterized protein n=1 Tax=Suillus fuscotomentosus TaxID=1912939 RepID=A0AAD4HC72_9AGAM|nr:uncharacterized protein F5891DRAFT_1177759 [Suillus fuscotomentosus]KAG1886942.1 hypothetical protein F5891DRAFT_1177759 [Suillus fuscotomentosus]